ncbi:2-amino-4-hydroxy-6-hydroxymethyldihydropteridine pyrophosphokinase [Salipiger pallidus]|uniref:2-amino-4-hydroxy-6-hydroxymethyldihydropteridine pyrophosphokinase n=1 Tax=Salipiger pallidus TaxID=1775170 RepID=A0A8J2ZJF8_9RHOB|nr:2-amino-4-hydroxy-6-hydroxymethyldihydropteridine pyrophosphokinase [Salipiger pallidus]
MTLDKALQELGSYGIRVRHTSPFYATSCFPAGAGPDYVNACAAAECDLAPVEILEALHRVEALFSRQRDQRWGARSLDLDLIAIGDMVLPDASTQAAWRALPPDRQTAEAPDQLIVPHPRMQDRAFVLVPLCDVASDWRHPLLALSAQELCDALPPEARAEVVPL